MSECLLALVGGLLGSAHCVGMCGGLVVQLTVRGQRPAPAIGRQIVYGLGRVLTYSVMGLAAGYAGLRLKHQFPDTTMPVAILTIIGGVAFILVGCSTLGIRLWSRRQDSKNCSAAKPFADLYGAANHTHIVLGGMMNGLLPCGLVYSFLAIAFATGNIWHGAAVMACFGLGTIPALATLGVGVAALPCKTRQHVMRAGGLAMIVVAILMVYRGGTALAFPNQAVICPFCTTP